MPTTPSGMVNAMTATETACVRRVRQLALRAMDDAAGVAHVTPAAAQASKSPPPAGPPGLTPEELERLSGASPALLAAMSRAFARL